jgi:PKD repeat protein
VQRALIAIGIVSCLNASVSLADCTLTNVSILPLNEMGFRSYAGYPGGLYPNHANARPPAHEAAGVAIAQAIQPLDSAGNVDTNNGKIVLLSLGMSNATQEWASKGTNNFYRIATNDPSLNPRVRIVDGAFGGQDAPRWTNILSSNWFNVITQRLVSAGVTTNQVQVLWLKEALAGPSGYGAFPAHALVLKDQMAAILRNAKARYPNLKLAFVSPRTRAYTASPGDLNPEPFAFESGFSCKWLIEDQINGTGNLNYNSSNGPVVAPWISWGPYIWANGTLPRGDGLTWLCSDLESDFTHPSPDGGVPKVAKQLLAFFKTDSITLPWYLKKSGAGGPTCAPTASTTNGTAPLTVTFSANPTSGTAPFRDVVWTFEDGDYATNANPVKVFATPGIYRTRLTVTDTNGNTAAGTVAVTVNSSYELWAAGKFTATELTNITVSGYAANPDGDSYANLLEYALGLDPKASDGKTFPALTVTGGVAILIYPHLKWAADVALSVEVSSNLTSWGTATVVSVADNGVIESLSAQSAVSAMSPSYFRVRASK